MTPAPAAGAISVVAKALPAPSPVDKGLRWVTSILVLVFPTATLFVNRGDSYSFWLLVLIGIWVWMRYGARPFLDRWSGTLLLVFALFFGVTVVAYIFGVQTQDGFRFLGRYLRFLFVAPVFLAFRRYQPTAKTVFIGLAVGAFAGGVGSVWHFLHIYPDVRMEAATDLSIIFGDLTTTMVLCTIAGFGLMAASKRAWLVLLLILSLAGGLAATLLSGTRGAWIPLLGLPLFLMTPMSGFLKRRYLFAILLVLVAVFSSFYFMTRTGTQARIKQAFHYIPDYFVGYAAASKEPPERNFLPQCVNSRRFLNRWSSMYSETRQPFLSIRVVHTDEIEHECGYKYAVQLRNLNASKWVGYAFPRVARKATGLHRSQILVRGRGEIVLSGVKQESRKFDSQKYELIHLTSHGGSGRNIGVYVPPTGEIWIIPVDGYFGEYSLSIGDNSVGIRLELWRAAWYLFLTHPLLGVGTGAYQPSTQRLIAIGVIAPFAGTFDHPHNDFLNALASFGIVGFAALLAVFLLPAWFFMRAVRSGERSVHALGLAGLFTVIGFAIYALTDVVFLHNMMITWYVVYMALFYALLSTRASRTVKAEPPEQ